MHMILSVYLFDIKLFKSAINNQAMGNDYFDVLYIKEDCGLHK